METTGGVRMERVIDGLAIMVYNEFWPLFLVAGAVLIQVPILALQFFNKNIMYKEHYRRIFSVSWVFIAVAVLLAIGVSSPWLIVAIVVAVLAMGLVAFMQYRQRANLRNEGIQYFKAIVGLMNAGMTLGQAMSHSVTDATLMNQYPRLTDIVQRVIVERRSGKALSVAMAEVTSITYGAKDVWSKVTMAAREFDKGQHGVSSEVQLQSVDILVQIIERSQNLEQELKRELSQMTFAQWIFVLIIPGINVYQYQMVAGYPGFLSSALGKVVLGFEFLAITVVFIIFERLKKLPEFRV